jgi:hypothetical protein
MREADEMDNHNHRCFLAATDGRSFCPSPEFLKTDPTREKGKSMKRRTEITIEIERVTVISRHGKSRSWCAACGAEVAMMTACDAAQLMNVSIAVIHRLAEAAKVHFTVTPNGMLMICPNSLANLNEQSAHFTIHSTQDV